ncbi:hypothetical protein B0J11DRAFT_277164 [Dendryphion nanum]|uniref:Uncharacterized protein n=1 Tax=Dendryphion nanum TaxID=256645 RepID=A0A9P9E0M8_9PLEO|nr:hypothetical protein B0J11DRAFT_277164 [Dendryphion nanum]
MRNSMNQNPSRAATKACQGTPPARTQQTQRWWARCLLRRQRRAGTAGTAGAFAVAVWRAARSLPEPKLKTVPPAKALSGTYTPLGPPRSPSPARGSEREHHHHHHHRLGLLDLRVLHGLFSARDASCSPSCALHPWSQKIQFWQNENGALVSTPFIPLHTYSNLTPTTTFTTRTGTPTGTHQPQQRQPAPVE